MRRSIARIALTAALALGAAVPAAQAEDFKTTFGAGTPTSFAWAGEATAVASIPSVAKWGCANDEVSRCDRVIFDVKDAGELDISVKMDTAPTCDPAAGVACDIDVDLYLYPSAADGTYPEGTEPVGESATADQEEKFKAKVKPGYYVLEVEPYQGQGVTYKGVAKYAGPPAPAAPAPPVVDPGPPPTYVATPPPPPQQPEPPAEPMTVQPERTGKRAACRKKARKIKKASKRRKALKACSRKPV